VSRQQSVLEPINLPNDYELHTSKREKPYIVDKSLLFDLNVHMNFKP
jgi:hypothetical protein